jgi:putative ATP-dependent endonuclease of OLD family
MPDEAQWIVGKLKQDEAIPTVVARGRRWRVKADFPGNGLEKRREERRARASGQRVETFVANEWTLEFDLAYYGLRLAVWLAAHFALADDKLVDGKTTKKAVALACAPEFFSLVKQKLSFETFAAYVYAKFEKDNVSKAIAAQYLAEHLEDLIDKGKWQAINLLERLPPYLIQAIEHVTEPFVKKEGDPV